MRGSVSSAVTPRLFRSAAFAMLCVIWGSTWLAIRIGLQGAPPFLAATLRFLLASITLAVVAIVLSATCAAFATVAIKRWGHATDPVTFNAAAMAVGTASLAVVSFGARESWHVPSWPEGIGAILFLALAGSVVTFVTWQWLLKTAEATSLSFVALITPITAVLLGAGVGNEKFDAVDLAGSAIVLAGIYVSISRRVAGLGRALVGRTAPGTDPIDPPGRQG